MPDALLSESEYHNSYEKIVNSYFPKVKKQKGDASKIAGEDYDMFCKNFTLITSKNHFDEDDYSFVYMHIICNQYSRASYSALTKWEDEEQMKPFYAKGLLNKRKVPSLESESEAELASENECVTPVKKHQIVVKKETKKKSIKIIDSEAEESDSAMVSADEVEIEGEDKYETGSFVVSDEEEDNLSQASSRYSGKKRKMMSTKNNSKKKVKKSAALLANLSLIDSDLHEEEEESPNQEEKPKIKTVTVLNVLEDLGIDSLVDVLNITEKVAIRTCGEFAIDAKLLPRVVSKTGITLQHFEDTEESREKLTECLFSSLLALAKRAVGYGRENLLEKNINNFHRQKANTYPPVHTNANSAPINSKKDVTEVPQEYYNPLYSSSSSGGLDLDALVSDGPSYKNTLNSNGNKVFWWQLLDEENFSEVTNGMEQMERENLLKKVAMECGKLYSSKHGLKRDPVSNRTYYTLDDKDKMREIVLSLKERVRKNLQDIKRA